MAETRGTVSDPGNAMTDPVRGSVWITGQLRQAILDGRYAPGEKLPAERKFASAFGASRATIRTALSRLETERLVTRRLGAGTFVNTDLQAANEEVADLTSPLELIEVRLGIEPNMVRLAVLNATPRDIERLEGHIGRMPAAAARTASRSRASFTPPALPRPPACTWAFTTQTAPPNARAASAASSGLAATCPAGTGIP